ncbi:Signal peptide protein OS=Rhodopirellula europaea 6C GN=RE6C_05291 PE=4 SV=1: DUF1551 [Gemmataceae bacterium]|nr:Signal peptide protein OS=Rhodopirellula europaea 6C GN=RE6C_05291 PE=4 SV=1: DUF1551 [Gemmataceae bacterium]VTT99912.1 Signal peptide protein OS=Rhodopirellula europaea 6C GN=RE6C_05291 PE=4 SV=1: DUF1551 [Gemmataceae bacterium]
MRASLLSCSLGLLTAAQAAAQGPPAALPPVPAPKAAVVEKAAPVPAAPAPAAPLLIESGAPAAVAPTLSEATFTGLTGDGGLAPAGHPFPMCGPRFWIGADYTLFWYNSMQVPTLVQTIPSALVNTPNAFPATNFPSDPRVGYNGVSGVRVNAGVNFDRFGVDFSGFLLQQQNLDTQLANDGTPVFLGRPFLDASAGGTPATVNISVPNQYNGAVESTVTSQLYGFDVNARRAWYTFVADQTNLLAGFRYIDLRESVGVSTFSQFPTGDSVAITDLFRTHNSFYGGQIGFNIIYGGTEPGFGFQFTSKSGIGGVNQRVDIFGSNTITQSGVVTTEAGGLLARSQNLGGFSRSKFAYMQDIDLKLTYNFTSNFQVSFGYSLIYLSSVVRAGSFVNPLIDPSTIRFTNGGAPSTPSPVPTFAWNANSFVVQGLTFGAQFQY